MSLLAGSMRFVGAVLALPVRAYQLTLGRFLPDRCRFTPSCSSYTVEALRVNGPFGLVQALWRVLRCQPFSAGGHDPVRAIRPWRAASREVTRG